MPTDLIQPIAHLSENERSRFLLALNELVGNLSIASSKPVDELSFCETYQLKPSFFLALRDLDALVYDFSKFDEVCAWYKSTPKLMKVTPEDVYALMHGGVVRVSEQTGGWVKRPETSEGTYTERMEAAKADLIIEFFTAANNAGAVDTDVASVVKPSGVKTARKPYTRKVSAAVPKADDNTLESEPIPPMPTPPKPYPLFPFSDDAAVKATQQERLKILSDDLADIPVPKTLDEMIQRLDTKPVVLAQPYTLSLNSEDMNLTMNVKTTEDSDIVDAILYKLHRVS